MWSSMRDQLRSVAHGTAEFLENTGTKLGLTKKSPESYSYTVSSSTTVTPEHGTVSQLLREYTDEHGHKRKEIQRILDGKSVTETWELDENDKEQGAHQTKLKDVKELSDFEEKWKILSDDLPTFKRAEELEPGLMLPPIVMPEAPAFLPPGIRDGGMWPIFGDISKTISSFNENVEHFFSSAQRLVQGTKDPAENPLLAPDKHSYSYSLSSAVCPEHGENVGEMCREYVDSYGNKTKEVQRIMGSKSILESWTVDKEGKTKQTKDIQLENVKENELKEFEEQWMNHAKSVLPERLPIGSSGMMIGNVWDKIHKIEDKGKETLSAVAAAAAPPAGL